MTDLMIFTLRNTTNWWKYLAENLESVKSVAIVTDIRNDNAADICIIDDFYKNLKFHDCKKIAIEKFGVAICEDIIKRCRVLRNHSRNFGLKLIGGMILTLEPVLLNKKPKIIISFVIDRYTSDVFERLATMHGIKFVEVTASILPNYIMFMTRGRYFPVRVPEALEIAESTKLLTDEHFAPSYVNMSNKFSISKFCKTFVYFKARAWYFNLLKLIHNDKYNLHYMDSSGRLSHKPRVLDILVLKCFDSNWQTKLNNSLKLKNVFLPLAVLPEASLDYWLSDYSILDNDKVVLETAKVLTQAGYMVFVKDHPLQFGFRKRKVIYELKKIPNVILVPYAVPATVILKNCSVCFTMTGTVGFQALFYGNKSIVSNAYYSDKQTFISIDNFNDIKNLPLKIKEFNQNNINQQAIGDIVSRLLSSSIPGDLFSFRKFNKNNNAHRDKVKDLIFSLNKYLSPIIND